MSNWEILDVPSSYGAIAQCPENSIILLEQQVSCIFIIVSLLATSLGLIVYSLVAVVSLWFVYQVLWL